MFMALQGTVEILADNDDATGDLIHLQKHNEQTPSKVESNDEPQKRNCKKEEEECNIEEQPLRRSVRRIMKPKRYDDPPPPVEVRKAKITQKENSQKGKSATKRKPESFEKQSEQLKVNLSEREKAPAISLKEGQTPKKICRKLLFRKHHARRRKIFPLNKLQDILMELDPPSPPKVPILTLNDMTVDEILNTFEPNKEKLDSLFQKIESAGYIYCYEGISHYLVIELITNDMQNLMMTRLSEQYEKETNPMYGSHVINVLMPEWILNIFMERFNMKRDEAIRYIKEQNSYTGQLVDSQKKPLVPRP